VSGTSWLILWALILAFGSLFWILLLRRTYLRFKTLRAEVRKLMTAISAIGELKAAKQTRLTKPDPAFSEEGL